MLTDRTPAMTEERTEHFLTLDFEHGILRIALVGPNVGQREAPIISEESMKTLRTLDKRVKAVVLDLTDVNVMSSMGLGFCIDLRNRAHKLKAKTFVVGMNRELRELFSMMKVERLFNLVSTRDDLDKALRNL